MMSAEKLAQFYDRKYLNLVTYRRSGTAVSTPLCFVEEGGVPYVRTPARFDAFVTAVTAITASSRVPSRRGSYTRRPCGF